jgi:hypothetical protein
MWRPRRRTSPYEEIATLVFGLLILEQIPEAILHSPAKSPVGSPESSGDQIVTTLPPQPQLLTREKKKLDAWRDEHQICSSDA